MSAEPQLFRINPENRESEKIVEVDFARLGFQERRDIQEWVAANPGILGDGLLIIGKEFSGFDRTNERLDLLAVDQDGKLVVIELKRDHTGSDAHWQAIKYASYIYRAKHDDIIRMFADYVETSETEAVDRLLQHLGADDLNSLNNNQRIILASHRFAPEVTSASLWLNEKTSDQNLITCVQLIPYHDAETNALYIQANTIIPMLGAEEYSIGIGDALSEEGKGRRSSLGTKLSRTFRRNKNDEFTTFLRKTADIALNALPEEIRPNRTSRWAGSDYNRRIDGGRYIRYYHVWYNTTPWGNWDASYRMNLYPTSSSDAWESGPWGVNVELAYIPAELVNRIVESQIDGDLEAKDDCVTVTYTSDALDDTFADTLANRLKHFVEDTSSIVNEFEDERTNQEDV